MAQEIFVVKTMGDALRNTGYKNIESAMAEIVDNSIQADADNVFIIISEKYNEKTGRNNIDEIAFLDNGIGMDVLELSKCLGIGYSTRTDRKGMGRFGVGLPQSSLYACPSVEVYSWQNGCQNCKKVFLDIEKVKKGEQKEIEDPTASEIPEKYSKYLEYKSVKENKVYDFKDHGTFVLWKKCDRVNPRTVKFLMAKLDFALGQKFRYFIHENLCNIKLIHEENQDLAYNIMPNDPLMLMGDNYVLGNPDRPGEISPRDNTNCTETVFEPFGNEEYPDGVVEFPIDYMDPVTYEKKTSNVILTFSSVKNLFYDKTAIAGNPGGTQLGKHVKKLEGISIVRANREIDFGEFDFYENINQPEHRWWGCEIRFTPELDEAFGVANNKQHVELQRLDASDYVDEEVKPVWLQLWSIIHTTIDAMYAKNKKTRENARNTKANESPATQIINEVEKNNEDVDNGEAGAVLKKTPRKELEKRAREKLQEQGVENPTDEDAALYINNKVNLEYKNLGRTAGLFDYSFSLGNCLVAINMDHIFYKTILRDLFSTNDVKVAFELFIASLVKAIDETNLHQTDENDNLIATWHEKLRKYINKQQNNIKN